MAIAIEELTPAIAGEYQALTAGGAAAGRETLRRARANVSARQGVPVARRDPVVFSQGRSVGRPAPGAARAAFQHLPSGGQKGGLGVGIRLIWAAAAALVALEVLSLATGRYFTWDLKGGLSSLRQAGSYLGLYPGQTVAKPTPPPANAPTASYTTPSYGTNPVIPGVIVAAQGANAPGFR